MIIVGQSLGSRPILVPELFTLVPRLFGTTCRCLSVQPVQLPPSRNIWRHISLIWPFPHRYRHSPWPVDVTELFPRFCCWTLIWLSRHWAWLRRGYWRYKTLIDWLIGWLIDWFYQLLLFFPNSALPDDWFKWTLHNHLCSDANYTAYGPSRSRWDVTLTPLSFFVPSSASPAASNNARHVMESWTVDPTRCNVKCKW